MLSVCVFVYYHVGCYVPRLHFCMSKARFHGVHGGIFQICSVWLLLKMLCSKFWRYLMTTVACLTS